MIAPLNRIPIDHITGSKDCPAKTFARSLTYLSRRMVGLRSGSDVNWAAHSVIWLPALITATISIFEKIDRKVRYCDR